MRDLTEFTEAEGRDDTHHGSTLGTDPCRTSTKPSTSNEPVCGLRSLGEQPNQKSSIDQRSSDKEPDKPSSKHRDSSATQSSAPSDPVVEHRTSVAVYGLRPAESINCNNISDASEARSSSHDLDRHTVSIVALSIIVMAGITQHGGAAPSVIAPRIGRTWLPASASAMHQTAQQTRSWQYRWSQY